MPAAHPWLPARAVVVGGGLIGGSVVAALRRVNPAMELTVIEPRGRARRVLRARFGVSTRARWFGSRPPPAADLYVLATPPKAAAAYLADPRGRPVLRDAALVIDTCSTKRRVVAAAWGLSSFVGGHPMAGAERGGPGASRADLFEGRPFALCPGPDTSRRALALARRFVRALGGHPVRTCAHAHDHAVALTSHVPHVVAWALLDQLASDLPEAVAAPRRLLAAGSLRDATRVAMADPALWESILADNRDRVADSLEALAGRLAQAAAALRAGRPVVASSSGGPPCFEGAYLGVLRRRLARVLAPKGPPASC